MDGGGGAGGGDVAAALSRAAHEARRRMLSRSGDAAPSWPWVVARTLRVLLDYSGSMGTTLGILDSELQMEWSQAAARRRSGVLANLALDHRFDPYADVLDVQVVEAAAPVSGMVDTLTVEHAGSGERVRCILHSKLDALRAGASPIVGVGRALRLSGCRFVRLPPPAEPGAPPSGNLPAYAVPSAHDNDRSHGALTLLPTPATSVLLGSGSGTADVGGISPDDVLMMGFETGLQSLLGVADGGEISINVRVAGVQPTEQDPGPLNTNAPPKRRWRTIVLADDECEETCHLRLHGDQVMLGDQVKVGDYIGLQGPIVVNEACQVHVEIDDARTLIFIRPAELGGAVGGDDRDAAGGAGAGTAPGVGDGSGAGFSEGGVLARLLEVEGPRPAGVRWGRGSIGYDASGGGGTPSQPTPPTQSASQSAREELRWELRLRLEAVGGSRPAGGEGAAATVLVEYTARRDGLKDLAAELLAGQLLWLDGLAGSTEVSERAGAGGGAEAYSLKLPVDTTHASSSGATANVNLAVKSQAEPGDDAGGVMIMVSCARGLLHATYLQSPLPLARLLEQRTQHAHCRATITAVDVLPISIASPFPFPAKGGAPTQSPGVRSSAEAAIALGRGLRLTLEDGCTSLRVSVHPRAAEMLWHSPLYELAAVRSVDRNRKLGKVLGQSFELLLSLVPGEANSGRGDAVQYRLDCTAPSADAGLAALVREELS